MSKPPTTLSLNKLEDLLSRHNYTLVSVYHDTVGKSVVFLEIRTPRVQKTFFVFVPKKYKMKCDSSTHKTLDVTYAPSQLTSEGASRQIEYLKEIKGPLLECDLISISSSMISMCKNNDVAYVYTFGASLGDEDENEVDMSTPDEENDVVDTVDQLVKDAKKLGKIIDPSAEKVLEIEPEESEEEEEKETKEENKGETADALEKDAVAAEEETPIELEFDDTPLPATTEGETSVADENDAIATEEVVVQPQPKESSLKRRVDNSLPEGIEDAELSIGIIYYAIDLDVFYKKVAVSTNASSKAGSAATQTLENEILGIYDALDDNESDMRVSKLDEISELATKIAQQTKQDVEIFKREEMSLKTQILKLSAVLDQTENLRARIAKAPTKFVETKPEVDRLYNQTKTTLHEINVELLKNRDTVDDLLSRVQISLEEILEF